MTTYNNLPNTPDSNSLQKVVRYFDNYYVRPIDLEVESVDVLKGFFESRGFNPVSAENISYVILKTAKESNYKPQEIIDSLKNYEPLQLNEFLLSIMNYNRVKTSSLGIIYKLNPIDQVQRNIRA
jgi:hypothetical protein